MFSIKHICPSFIEKPTPFTHISIIHHTPPQAADEFQLGELFEHLKNLITDRTSQSVGLLINMVTNKPVQNGINNNDSGVIRNGVVVRDRSGVSDLERT